MDSSGSETAFRDIPNSAGYVPAITLGAGEIHNETKMGLRMRLTESDTEIASE